MEISPSQRPAAAAGRTTCTTGTGTKWEANGKKQVAGTLIGSPVQNSPNERMNSPVVYKLITESGTIVCAVAAAVVVSFVCDSGLYSTLATINSTYPT